MNGFHQTHILLHRSGMEDWQEAPLGPLALHHSQIGRSARNVLMRTEGNPH